ncbi:Uncharacterized protein APZ42_014211 [Daphnia magna]|uniref:Uncharacterized protein n=1 Tax=Daphnia magna TaxID=35525 RepID=A0A162Q1W9_9CRUS|nr:Uncharacterized protein APZ42_014211 [Daphnia magna]
MATKSSARKICHFRCRFLADFSIRTAPQKGTKDIWTMFYTWNGGLPSITPVDLFLLLGLIGFE